MLPGNRAYKKRSLVGKLLWTGRTGRGLGTFGGRPWLSALVLFLSYSVVSDALRPHEPARLLCPWNSPGKNTGEGSHSLL